MRRWTSCTPNGGSQCGQGVQTRGSQCFRSGLVMIMMLRLSWCYDYHDVIEDADFADGRPVSGSLCAHLVQPGENEVSCRCRHTFDLHTITITKSYLDLNISFLVPLLLSFSSSTSSALSIAALTAQWTAWSPPGPPGTHLPASAACSSQTWLGLGIYICIYINCLW